jgi:ATP-dependent DNA helicase PIF1
MSYAPNELINNFDFLARLLKLVQHHVCDEVYCQRLDKQTNVKECWFLFPQRSLDAPELWTPPGRTFERFRAKRNDEFLNQYNQTLLMGWLANIDISPCTSRNGVIEYVIKYASKAEKQSEGYRHMVNRILRVVNPDRPFQSLVTKMMNQLIGERDWSAQEVCHYLLNLPLVNSSRDVVSVDMRPESQHADMYFVDENSEDPRKGKSILQKYKERPLVHEGVTFLQFLQSFNHRAPFSLRPRAKPRIVNYFPRYKPDDVNNYRRCKLMMHRPFRQVKDLLVVEGEEYGNDDWFGAWEAWIEFNPEVGTTSDGLDDEEDLEPEESEHEGRARCTISNVCISSVLSNMLTSIVGRGPNTVQRSTTRRHLRAPERQDDA